MRNSALKIYRISDYLSPATQVNRKEDGSHARQEKRQRQDEKSKDGDDEPLEKFEVSEEKVDEAIQQLQADIDSHATNLHVDVEGQGPGMKVLLRDKSGATIRQYSGEEFLKLRETAAASGANTRGKLLDRKL